MWETPRISEQTNKLFILKDANSIYTNHFGSVTIWLISRSRGRFYLGSPWPRFYQYFSFKLAHFYTKKFMWSLPLHEVKHPNGQDKFDDLFESLVKIKLEPWQIRLIYIYYCGRKRHDLYSSSVLDSGSGVSTVRGRSEDWRRLNFLKTDTEVLSPKMSESHNWENLCATFDIIIFLDATVFQGITCAMYQKCEIQHFFIETFHEIYITFVN